MEVLLIFGLAIAVLRGVRGRRKDRSARQTVARALRGTTSSDAKFARYPGRW